MKNENDLSVFVTYGWCRSSYAVIRSLKQHGIDIHVGDDSLLAMSRFSRYCKSFTKLPDFFVEPQRYFEETCYALKKTGAKVLLPGHEDLGLFSRYKDNLPPDICVAVPDWDSYNVAEDKFAVLDVAREVGCPVPHTTEVTSLSQLTDLADSLSWPAIIKTRIGNSAKGVRIVENKEELIKEFNELIQTFALPKGRWPIVQEFLPGEAAGVCLLYDHGRCIAFFAETYIRCKKPGRFGTSTLRQEYNNPQLIIQAMSVFDRLKWHGVAHVDFVADRKGIFKLIEINPRLWGALSLSIYSGTDFPYLWYLISIGKSDPDLRRLTVRQKKCRWIIGDFMAFFEFIKHNQLLDSFKIMKPELNCYHDDFSLTDPLPFIFEVADYFAKFIKAGFSTNPVRGNMIR